MLLGCISQIHGSEPLKLVCPRKQHLGIGVEDAAALCLRLAVQHVEIEALQRVAVPCGVAAPGGAPLFIILRWGLLRVQHWLITVLPHPCHSRASCEQFIT